MAERLFAFLMTAYQVAAPAIWTALVDHIASWTTAYIGNKVLMVRRRTQEQVHGQHTHYSSSTLNAAAHPGNSVTVIVPPGTQVTITVQSLPDSAS